MLFHLIIRSLHLVSHEKRRLDILFLLAFAASLEYHYQFWKPMLCPYIVHDNFLYAVYADMQ